MDKSVNRFSNVFVLNQLLVRRIFDKLRSRVEELNGIVTVILTTKITYQFVIT